MRNECKGEADDLVWDDEIDLELDIDTASGSLIETSSNMIVALTEDEAYDDSADASSVEEDATDPPHLSELSPSRAPDVVDGSDL